jgi:hypothetical protein
MATLAPSTALRAVSAPIAAGVVGGGGVVVGTGRLASASQRSQAAGAVPFCAPTKLCERAIPDFSNWKNDNSYEEAFQRLMRDLHDNATVDLEEGKRIKSAS